MVDTGVEYRVQAYRVSPKGEVKELTNESGQVRRLGPYATGTGSYTDAPNSKRGVIVLENGVFFFKNLENGVNLLFLRSNRSRHVRSRCN